MNQIIESLYARKSVRAFTEQEIPEEIVQVILEASTQAPTAGNQQLYTILRITDPVKKHRLSISCDNQPFIEKAKLVLVYCACRLPEMVYGIPRSRVRSEKTGRRRPSSRCM